jgi:hypothetical protein
MIYRILPSILLFTAVLPLHAGSFSFSGTLNSRDDLALFRFSVNPGDLITLRTFGYAGGLNAAGGPIPDGGFDPAIAIFTVDAPQFLLTLDDAGHCGGSFVGADPATGLCLDSELEDLSLPAATYLVSLTQSDHLPIGPTLSDGFTPGTAFGPTEFVDFTGSVRTGNWALDILGASSAAQVPEPGSSRLLVLGMLLTGCRAIRQQTQPRQRPLHRAAASHASRSSVVSQTGLPSV